MHNSTSGPLKDSLSPQSTGLGCGRPCSCPCSEYLTLSGPNKLALLLSPPAASPLFSSWLVCWASCLTQSHMTPGLSLQKLPFTSHIVTQPEALTMDSAEPHPGHLLHSQLPWGSLCPLSWDLKDPALILPSPSSSPQPIPGLIPEVLRTPQPLSQSQGVELDSCDQAWTWQSCLWRYYGVWLSEELSFLVQGCPEVWLFLPTAAHETLHGKEAKMRKTGDLPC